MRVVGVTSATGESRDDVGLSVCNGSFRLVREQDGSWFLYGPPKPWSVKELRQLAEGIGIVTASPDAPTADDVTVEGGVDASAVDDARDLLQEHAETNGEGTPFGGPDVEFGVGPAEDNETNYSVHVLSEMKLKELERGEGLKVPIKMLKIGSEYMPDKTFSSTTVTTETYAEWRQHVWPVWRLHEDGFIELSADGKTAQITPRGRILLKQISDGISCVYGDSDLRNTDATPEIPVWLMRGADGGGAGGSIPSTWMTAVEEIGVSQLIIANGDPKTIADGLWAVAQALKLGVPDDVLDLVEWACSGYDRIDEVEDDIDKRIEAALAGPPIASPI